MREHLIRYWAPRLGITFAAYPEARWRNAPLPPHARVAAFSLELRAEIAATAPLYRPGGCDD